ncbi:metal-dependent hydrolase family protein [Sphingomonas jatrophae]|uniref:Imidazolonepropionase n=1 Tax=Sphingomonas jatrophae TaxID=1166337 RepID=A0A1I6KZ49_9SPHN|nr:amidohydrolase family protein [Sphingomonas jatrophae]SFR96506.1 Imidazolonepropionase [Sphingomonas jatrophae]
MKTIAAVGLAMLASAAGAQGPATYIHAGALLDRPGQAPRGASTIIVRSGRIDAVRDGFVAPEAGAQLVDLKNRFVLPGLIDTHVHLWGIGGDPMRKRLEMLTRDTGDNLMTAVVNARTTLAAGFTTVRDLGGDPRGMRALRDAVARGDVAGPTIVNAGLHVSTTGGSGDLSTGMAEQFAEAMHDHASSVCNGPDDCRRAVREQVKLGALVIKITATGGVLNNIAGGLGRMMTPAELDAIVETAHGFGRKVASHSHALEGTRASLTAGVDSIEHGSYLDDDTIAMFKAKGVWLVPTMLAFRAALEQARAGQLPPAVLPKAEAAAAVAMANHKRAIASGVKIAFGTDSGVSVHGGNAREFALLVEAGMTPARAIRAATVDAAELIGQSERVGSIEVGKAADLIAVTGSPLDDVRRLERVEFVMKDGVVSKSAAQPAPPSLPAS